MGSRVLRPEIDGEAGDLLVGGGVLVCMGGEGRGSGGSSTPPHVPPMCHPEAKLLQVPPASSLAQDPTAPPQSPPQHPAPPQIPS